MEEVAIIACAVRGITPGNADQFIMALAPLNFEKTIQAAAVFLRRAQGSAMTRMRLLKLLAIADREAIRVGGRAITGDGHVAMEHGPVLTTTYRSICGKGKYAAKWAQFFGNNGQEVVLENDPGDGKLSNFESEILTRVEADFRRFTTAQLRNYTHEMSDWAKHDPGPGRMNPIPDSDMLDALNLTKKKDVILEASAKEKIAAAAFEKFSR